MKHFFTNQTSIEEMIQRAACLKSSSRALWGQMNATEMLLHCNLCNQQILQGDIDNTPGGFRKKLVKLLALYVVPHFPRHMQSAERNITQNKIAVAAFDRELERFTCLIKQFSNGVGSAGLNHPAFGKLNDKEWKIAAWKHTDHHLRQFGV